MEGQTAGARAVKQQADEKILTDIGCCIYFPPCDEYDPRISRMSKFMPDASENGFCLM